MAAERPDGRIFHLHPSCLSRARRSRHRLVGLAAEACRVKPLPAFLVAAQRYVDCAFVRINLLRLD